MYAAVGTAQETVFPLAGEGELASLQRKAWASSYDSLPSSSALDDGLDPQPPHLDRCAAPDIQPVCSIRTCTHRVASCETERRL